MKGWRDFIRCTINDAQYPEPEDLKAYRDGIECARRGEIAEQRFAAECYGFDLFGAASKEDEDEDESTATSASS